MSTDEPPSNCAHPEWRYAYHEESTWYGSVCTSCGEGAVHHVDRIEWIPDGFYTYLLREASDG